MESESDMSDISDSSDISDTSDYESSESEEETDDEYEFDGFDDFVKPESKKRYGNIKQDFEAITTLSSQPEIKANKKIQEIKSTLDILITNFPLQETNEIHSIYNHNPACLQSRKKFLIEYDLIIYFLEYKGISFPSNILPQVFPSMLIKPTKKATQKKRVKIKENFVFSNFDKDDETSDELYPKLKRYASGLFMFIKIQLMSKKRNVDEEKLLNILFIDPCCSFTNDQRLQTHIAHVTLLMTRIVMLNQYHIYFTDPCIGLNKTKTIDYQASLALRVIMRWVVETSLNSDVFLNYKIPSKTKELFEYKEFKSVILGVLENYKKETTLKRFMASCLEKSKTFLNGNGIDVNFR